MSATILQLPARSSDAGHFGLGRHLWRDHDFTIHRRYAGAIHATSKLFTLPVMLVVVAEYN
jgi:hypothetical protein